MISGLEERKYATIAEERAAKIVEEVDEIVGHTTDINKEELMNATYLELGKLMARWAKKLDRIEKRSDRHPDWVKNYVMQRGKEVNQFLPQLSTATVGFKLEDISYGQDRDGNLSDDLILLSEPFSMWMEDFDQLVAFCKKNGLDFFVDGFNRRLPGRCFRVAIFRPKTGRVSRNAMREKELMALQVFDDMRSDAVEESAFIVALVHTNEFDESSAEKMVKTLLGSGQIPREKLLR
jgi:hypothetical protein